MNSYRGAKTIFPTGAVVSRLPDEVVGERAKVGSHVQDFDKIGAKFVAGKNFGRQLGSFRFAD